MSSSGSVADAVVEAARRATEAAAARLLAPEGDALRVMAVAGSAAGWRLGESVPADSGGVGYVLASGQPFSVAPSGSDGRAVLCVPCLHEAEPVGALELVRGPGEDPFPIEAAGVAMLFAQIAGTAISIGPAGAAAVPSPRELAGELARIEASDPVRYASLARAIGALMS
jgi:hypothetical protein